MIENKFDGEVAIVTGSTRGIGASIAHYLADQGASVIVTGRTEEQGKATVADIESDGGNAIFVQADLRELSDIDQLFDSTAEKMGKLDILVNNAGMQTYTSIEEATIEDWNRVVETDFRSYWLCAKLASEMMGTGSIVNISSNHSITTQPGIFPYNAVKSGINGMTRAMALDLAPAIRVNSIVSGWVAVERTTRDMDEDRRKYLESIHPVGRLGLPIDIAKTVSFLADDSSAFITGENIVVDGGRSIVIEDENLPDYRQQRKE